MSRRDPIPDAETVLAGGLSAVVEAAVVRALASSSAGFDKKLDELASEVARLRGKRDKPVFPDDHGADPYITRNAALRNHFNVNRASAAAQMLIERLPWVELTEGRYHTRLSAIVDLKEQLENEARAKAAA